MKSINTVKDVVSVVVDENKALARTQAELAFGKTVNDRLTAKFGQIVSKLPISEDMKLVVEASFEEPVAQMGLLILLQGVVKTYIPQQRQLNTAVDCALLSASTESGIDVAEFLNDKLDSLITDVIGEVPKDL